MMFIRATRDGIADAPPPQIASETRAAVALVAHQASRTQTWTTASRSFDGALLQQLTHNSLLVPLTRREGKGHQLAAAFGPNVQFGAQSAPTAAEGLSLGTAFFAPAACWWARITVPSTKWTSQSNSPSRSLAACTSAKIRSQTPALRQRWNRLYTVGHLPYRSGRSRQGAPVRSTHRMPLTTSRSSFRGRPRPTRSGSNGSSFIHCSFVNSPRCMSLNLASLPYFAYTP